MREKRPFPVVVRKEAKTKLVVVSTDVLTDSQVDALNALLGGPVLLSELDKRVVNALERKEFVSTRDTAKGVTVRSTARGKAALKAHSRSVMSSKAA